MRDLKWVQFLCSISHRVWYKLSVWQMTAMLLFSDPWNPLTTLVAVIPEISSVLYASFKQTNYFVLKCVGEEVLFSFPYIMLCLQRPHVQKDLSPDGQSSFPRGERTEPKEINFTSHMLLFGATEGPFQPFLGSDDRLTLLPELPTRREGSP